VSALGLLALAVRAQLVLAQQAQLVLARAESLRPPI
jgi:hypothetical protein